MSLAGAAVSWIMRRCERNTRLNEERTRGGSGDRKERRGKVDTPFRRDQFFLISQEEGCMRTRLIQMWVNTP